jgi:hypothetical protein
MAFQQIPKLVLAATGFDPTGEAQGLSTSMQLLGNSLGVAILGALFMTSAAAFLVDAVSWDFSSAITPERRSEVTYQMSEELRTLTPEGQSEAVARLPAEVQEALADAGQQAVVNAMRLTLVASAGCMVLALASSVFGPPGVRPPS